MSQDKSLNYTSYLALEEILGAQRPKSEEHDEILFIVVHQVYELWFKQLIHELRYLQRMLEDGNDARAFATFKRALTILKQGQARDGGWGPYTSSQSEAFDTAIAVLALKAVRGDAALVAPVYTEVEWKEAIERGRSYLLTQQNDDGSWFETTRPARQESYSQRVSTTAWALLALLDE